MTACASNISPLVYHKLTKKVRSCFDDEFKMTEVFSQNRLSILAACEDVSTIATFKYENKKWPLIQTNQMWLEYELLKAPKTPTGFFVTSTTSYRDEPDPVPGRHDKIFPMYEFEHHGHFDKLLEYEGKLLEHLGYGKADSFPVVEYEDACMKYNVDEISHKEEFKLEEDYGPVVFLVNFKTSSNPFWNMKRVGNVAKKCDVILSGMETIGSAERSCCAKEMRNDFKTQSNGIYAKTLYNHFGSERVLKELEDYLSFDFIPRSGGGIGVTRLIRSMQKEKLL